MALGYARIRQAFTTLPLNYLHMNAHYQTIRKQGNTKLQVFYQQQISLLYHSASKWVQPDTTDDVIEALPNVQCMSCMNPRKQEFIPFKSNTILKTLSGLNQETAFLNKETSETFIPILKAFGTEMTQTLPENDPVQTFLSTFNKKLTIESCVLMQKELNFGSSHMHNIHVSRINSATPQTQSDKQPADDPLQKFHVLREKLQNEIPMFLSNSNQWHDFDDYTSDIQLYVTLKKSSFKCKGLWRYKRILSSFRRMCSWYLCHANLELLSISENEEQKTLEARWRVVGWSLLSMLSTFVLKMPTNPKYYDYVSTLHVNDDGQIFRHDVTKLRRVQDGLTIRSKLEVLKSGGMRAAALVNRLTPHLTKSNKDFIKSKQCPL
uniref:Uncharacterized protein LOC100182736 n=1 Tax=Phallusia mammillata TaxID=59560 RepID=A0A6F9DH60_9ASCI|nr:uncharacterized protein LOC100182736 [Phallusia mammillata]